MMETSTLLKPKISSNPKYQKEHEKITHIMGEDICKHVINKGPKIFK